MAEHMVGPVCMYVVIDVNGCSAKGNKTVCRAGAQRLIGFDDTKAAESIAGLCKIWL